MLEKIKSVTKVTRKSAKTGNDYSVLRVEFKDGYVIENFLNDDQKYILSKMENEK